MQSLISLQDQYIDRIIKIERSGVGLHRRRSRGAASRQLRAALEARGYSTQQAEAALQDAWDMARLQLAAEAAGD